MIEKISNRFRRKIVKKRLGGGITYTAENQILKKYSTIKISNNGSIVMGNVLLNVNTFVCSVGGVIELRDNVTINRNSILVCRESIIIKEGTSIGPNVCIYDHDHKYSTNGILKNEFSTAQIIIGKNCWIGAGAILLKGTKIGDNSIIGAGSVIKGVIPENSLVFNKRTQVIEDIKE